MRLLLASILVATTTISYALQLLRASRVQTAERIVSCRGVDFTVSRRAIDVTAVGLFDDDPRGFVGTFSARIVDRSTGLVVIGPIDVGGNDTRASDLDPFVFKNVTNARLSPGVYSLIAMNSSPNDTWLNTGIADLGGTVVIGDSGNGTVLITNGIIVAGDCTSATSATVLDKLLFVGATFLFEVVPTVAVALPQPEYPDCEAVACARLESGVYNIQGQARYCDNDEAGGGWLRLWRANDTTCEANGWTSTRNTGATGNDPYGCRPTSAAVCLGNRINTPFAFNEVRGSNWIVWALGTPDAFESPLPCEGAIVRDGNGSLVWAMLMGNPTIPGALCPCDPLIANTTLNWPNRIAAGDHWSCDRVPTQTGGAWIKLFDGTSNFLCTSRKNATAGNLLWFQRTLDAPQVALSVSLCVDQSPGLEDLKLASGDLYVRATAGFDRNKHCPTTMVSVSSSTVVDRSDVVGNDNDGVDTYWIIPTAIACVLAIIVCMLVAVSVEQKMRSNNANKQNINQQQSNEVSISEVSNKAPPKNQYADRLSDIVPRESRSQYGALSTQERGD
jgi:hypothetical protein